MLRAIALALLICAVSFVLPAEARTPPTDAKPLSQILQTIEQREDFGHFDEIEWDDDGYWEVEYISKSRSRVRLNVDPVTGEAEPASRWRR